MRARRARMSALASAYTLAVLVGLAALAVITARRGLRFDVTANQRNSLRPATEALLASIPEGAEPVDIVVVTSALVAGGDPHEAESQVRPLLKLFEHAGSRVRTSVRYAENEPALVQALAVDRVPLAVLHWQPPAAADGTKPAARERRTLVVTEDGLAEALRDLIEDRKRIAYVLFGHGEMRVGEAGGAGLSLLKTTLEGLNFDVRELALVGTGDVPADADLILIPGPQSDLLPEEVAALQRHADAGGRFLVLDGPTREPGMLNNLHGWLASSWNVGPLEGLVADFDVPLGADPRILLVMPSAEGAHPMVARITNAVQLPVTRGLVFLERAIEGVAPGSVLSSGARSWLETDLSTPAPHFDEGIDKKGPLDLAWAVTRRPEKQERESRLVVFGSRMAFANQYLGSGGNTELLRNAVDWATGREEDIAKRLGSGDDGSVIVSRSQGLIIMGCTVALPALVALAGVVTWWRRRKL